MRVQYPLGLSTMRLVYIWLVLFTMTNIIKICRSSFDDVRLERCNAVSTWEGYIAEVPGKIHQLIDTSINESDRWFFIHSKEWTSSFMVNLSETIFMKISCDVLSATECKACLNHIVDYRLIQACKNAKGAHVQVKECAVRFEYYNFFTNS